MPSSQLSDLAHDIISKAAQFSVMDGVAYDHAERSVAKFVAATLDADGITQTALLAAIADETDTTTDSQQRVLRRVAEALPTRESIRKIVTTEGGQDMRGITERSAGLIRLAKSTSPIAAHYRRRDFMTVLDEMAQAQRERGETYEQAFAKALKTEDGLAVHRALLNAEPEAPPQKPDVRVPSLDDDLPAWQEILEASEDLRRDEEDAGRHVTREQAIARFLATPEGRKLNGKYEAERARALGDQGY